MLHNRQSYTAMMVVWLLLTLAGLGIDVEAREAETPMAKVKPTDPPSKNQGRISLNAGIDFPTAYYFRGIRLETDDVIAQPYADVAFGMYQGGEGFNSLSATVGIWNSLHWGPTGSGGNNMDPEVWYEADFIGGLTFGFFDSVEMGAMYLAYTSPNGSFDDVQELNITLDFDDSSLLGDFALSPHLVLAIEVAGQSDEADPGDKGVYFEFGVEPGFTLFNNATYPVDVSFPLTVGLSLGGYYEDPVTSDDSTFGYFDGGIAVNVPLAFIPADFGTWTVSASGHFLFLGDTNQAFNNGDAFKALGIFGLSLAY